MTDSDVYLHDIAYALGDRSRGVEDAAACGATRSPAGVLRKAGFERQHVCAPSTSAYDLARAAADQLRDQLAPLDLLLYATCLPRDVDPDAFARSRDVKALMDFPAARLQAELDLAGAAVIGIDQQACTGMLGALRVGNALLRAEPTLHRALCIAADRFPDGALYEQSYNLVSDGAAACILSRQPRGYRVVACHAITNGGLGRATDDEVVGVYFTYTHRLVREILARADVPPDGLDWIVPQNMHPAGWTILCRQLGIARERVAGDSRAEVGHVISADNLINLQRLERAGAVRRGARVLLVMAGYGLNWQAVLLEKC